MALAEIGKARSDIHGATFASSVAINFANPELFSGQRGCDNARQARNAEKYSGYPQGGSRPGHEHYPVRLLD